MYKSKLHTYKVADKIAVLVASEEVVCFRSRIGYQHLYCAGEDLSRLGSLENTWL